MSSLRKKSSTRSQDSGPLKPFSVVDLVGEGLFVVPRVWVRRVGTNKWATFYPPAKFTPTEVTAAVKKQDNPVRGEWQSLALTRKPEYSGSYQKCNTKANGGARGKDITQTDRDTDYDDIPFEPLTDSDKEGDDEDGDDNESGKFDSDVTPSDREDVHMEDSDKNSVVGSTDNDSDTDIPGRYGNISVNTSSPNDNRGKKECRRRKARHSKACCPCVAEEHAIADSHRRRVLGMLVSLLDAVHAAEGSQNMDIQQQLPMGTELNFPLEEVEDLEKLEANLASSKDSIAKLKMCLKKYVDRHNINTAVSLVVGCVMNDKLALKFNYKGINKKKRGLSQVCPKVLACIEETILQNSPFTAPNITKAVMNYFRRANERYQNRAKKTTGTVEGVPSDVEMDES